MTKEMITLQKCYNVATKFNFIIKIDSLHNKIVLLTPQEFNFTKINDLYYFLSGYEYCNSIELLK